MLFFLLLLLFCNRSPDPQVTYESVEDVHLTGDPNSVYFNVGLESESETSEVLSLPGSSEEVRPRRCSLPVFSEEVGA